MTLSLRILLRAVHITAETKSFLGDSYVCHARDEIDDKVLRTHDISTFLIYPENRNEEENEIAPVRLTQFHESWWRRC